MSSLFKTNFLQTKKAFLILCFFTGLLSAIAQPTITSFSPTSGAVGTTVTINGTGFDSTATNNVVYFGGTIATIDASSSSSIKLVVTVPSGQTNERIFVSNTITGLVASSKFAFQTTRTNPSLFFPTQLNVVTADPAGVKAADFNSDGLLDFALINKSSNKISIYSNNSSGNTISFNTTPTELSGFGAIQMWYLDIADFDGDGKIDIAVQDYGASKIFVFRNTTSGNTLSFQFVGSFSSGSSTEGLDLEDMNGDGKIDILTGNYSSNSISFLRNTSIIGTISFATVQIFNNLGNTTCVASGDIDGDGKNDIVSGPWTGVFKTLLNTTANGATTLSLSTAVDNSISGNPWGIELADLDLDGDLDVIFNSGGVRIFLNNSTPGSVSFSSEISLSGSGYKLSVGDINGDGKTDILVYTSSGLTIHTNNYSSGSFSALSFSSTNYTHSLSTLEFSTPFVGDFNNDGKFDIGLSGSGNVAIKLSGIQAAISTSQSLTAFTACSGINSANQFFTVSGSNLSADIVITPPIGFEISLNSGSGYQTTAINLTQSGGIVGSTNIYIRTTTTATGSPSGNITLTSTGATQVNISASGTVNPAAVGGTIAGSTTVCSGSNSTTLTLSGHTGSITKWQSSTSSTFASGITDIVNTTTTNTATNLVATTYYRAVLTNGSCVANSAQVTITVSPTSVAGSISGAATVCSGTNSTILTLSGNTGSVTRWESSLNNFSTAGTTIANTTSTYTATNLSAITYYRAVVTSGSCAAVNSASVTMAVTVTPVVTNKTASICSGQAFTVAPTTGSGNTVPSGTTYTWTVADNTNVSGESAASSAQNTISQTLTNNSTSTQTVIYTVTPKNIGYSLGSTYKGGVIAYIFQPTDSGYAPGKVLIVKTQYLTGGTVCGASAFTFQSPTASTSTNIGEGLNNTNNLYAAGHTSTTEAIGLAYNYTDGTYSDWFIPSRDELNQVFTNVSSNFTSNGFRIRTSSEIPADLSTSYAYSIGSGFAAQNDGGCASVIVTRYDTLPTACDGATFTVTVTVTNNTWLGTTSTAWNTTTNWSCGAVPTATSNVIIASSSNQPIIGSDVSINSLTINSGTSLTVNSGFNLTVTNAVSNSGTLTLQNNANLLQDTATTTNSNTGSIIVKRNSSSLLRLDHTLWSSPVASQNLFSFSPSTLTNRFYIYDTAANAYATTGLSAATTFAAGKGYAVRAPNNHSSTSPTTWTGTFTGVPNNGTVPFTLDTASSGYNLVGNPYPSPINASAFLTENTSKIDGTLYFYAHSLTMNSDGTFPSGTNYCSWNTTAGVAATTAASGDFHPIPVTPNGIIQVGQGFFVKATAAGSINFTNAMRVSNNANQFLRTNELEKHRLWLNLTDENDTDINQIAVAYVEGATQGVDSNFDGLSFGNTGSSLSSKINNDDYVIQGRSLPFDSNDVVSLGFKATSAGNYKIKLTDKDGLFLGNQDVFVRDNLMGVEHNIKVAPYTFASQAGTFDNRFQLVYTQALGNPSTTFTPNAVNVYKTSDGFLVTANGIVMKDIHVYDISGRLIFKQTNINGTTTVLKGLSQTKQVLLLKITSQENETVTVKAIN